MRVIVVGAGVSGLAAATFLQSAGADVGVIEAGDAPGGNVRTDRDGGRQLDRAANGWLDTEPAMDRLLQLLGLQGAPIRAGGAYSTRWIVHRGALHPAPMSPPALLRSRLLPWWAKLRLLGDLFAPRGASGAGAEADESVGDFVRRRLGALAVDRLVGPMVAGIHAGDPDLLSLRAAFPRMFELERDHRSLLLAMLRIGRGGAPAGHLVTLPGGAGALGEAMAARIGGGLRCGQPATALERRRGGWRVHTADGAEDADAVVLACPAWAQAPLLRGVEPEAAAALSEIPYAPLAVVVTAWGADAFPTPPRGFGALVARGEVVGGVLGTVFTSSVFPHQALPGEHLLRTIIGGAIDPEAAAAPDAELLGRVRAHLGGLLGAPRADPDLVRVYRHPRGVPRYTAGHLQRVRSCRSAEARQPGLALCGNHLEGIGVKDCARAGELAARRVLRERGGA